MSIVIFNNDLSVPYVCSRPDFIINDCKCQVQMVDNKLPLALTYEKFEDIRTP
jgi:hypothetical protein